METTIDKAGRLVIPSELRRRAGFEPGVRIEATADENGVHLRVIRGEPVVKKEGNLLVVRPPVGSDAAPSFDLGKLINEERDRWP